MNINVDLLTSLYRKGVILWVAGGQLRIQVLRVGQPSQDLHGLRAEEAQLIELLEQMPLSSNVPLEPRAADCPVPLTAVQIFLWNHHIKQPRPSSIRECIYAVRVLGLLNTGWLQKSIDALMQRHESLRTKFVTVDGTLRQRIEPPGRYHLDLIDVSDACRVGIEDRVMNISEEFVSEKIDLWNEPLFAAKLIRLSDREHVLVLASHHMISDGVSNDILGKEIWAFYGQAAQGQAFSLPALPVQFADYAVWQEKTYSIWLEKHEMYWRERLKDAPRIRLPVKQGSTEATDPVALALRIPFGEALTGMLRDIAQREGTLLPLVTLSIYVAVMSRWCDRNDLLVAFLSHARYRRELETMVGCLVNATYLRIGIEDGDRFIDLVKRVTEEFYSACEHHDYNRVVSGLIARCETDLSFNWLTTRWAQGAADLQLGENRISLLPYDTGFVPPAFRFGTWMVEGSGGIIATLAYRPDLFATSTAERCGRNLRRFAEYFAERPHDPVKSVGLYA